MHSELLAFNIGKCNLDTNSRLFFMLCDESPGDELTCNEWSGGWTDRVESTCDESIHDKQLGILSELHILCLD